MQKWISLAEVVLANLAWLDDLELEGWLIVTAVVVGIGAAIWIFAGPWWLLVAATGYLLLLVGVRVVVRRGDRRRASS